MQRILLDFLLNIVYRTVVFKINTINFMFGTIRGQYYLFTVKTKAFRDLFKKQYSTTRGWVRYGAVSTKNSISLLYINY